MQTIAATHAAKCVRPAVRAPSRSAPRRCSCVVRAEKGAAEEVVDNNVTEYCSLDANGKKPQRELTLGEKEQLFLEAMMAFYMEEKPVLSNEEFDNLKDELQWAGSKVVVLTKEEQMLLEARMAFIKGKPIMSDADYDALKQSLAGASVFTVLQDEGPTCTLGKPGEKGKQAGEAQMDIGKMLLLTVPPALIVGGTLIGADMLLGGPLMHIPGAVGVIFWCGIILPATYVVASSISQAIFTDALVLSGACPNCGEVNTTYFGDILTVAGPREKSEVKCPCCESKLTFDKEARQVTVTELASSS